jgi:hypothetical protein
MILESSITPASGLPTMDDMSDAPADKIKTLLEQTVVLKLNGGLGTGMGLEQAKSLLPVKGKDTFLDFIAKQVICPPKSVSSSSISFQGHLSLYPLPLDLCGKGPPSPHRGRGASQSSR